MKHLAAYLLASLSGSAPTQAGVKKILESVGVESDEAQLKALFSALEGKDLAAVIAEGQGKLASMPSVAVGGAAPAASGAAAAAGGAEKKEEKKKEEEKEESDDDMGFGLFD
jgi:large subunit ribosomal protein LP2